MTFEDADRLEIGGVERSDAARMNHVVRDISRGLSCLDANLVAIVYACCSRTSS